MKLIKKVNLTAQCVDTSDLEKILFERRVRVSGICNVCFNDYDGIEDDLCNAAITPILHSYEITKAVESQVGLNLYYLHPGQFEKLEGGESSFSILKSSAIMLDCPGSLLVSLLFDFELTITNFPGDTSKLSKGKIAMSMKPEISKSLVCGVFSQLRKRQGIDSTRVVAFSHKHGVIDSICIM